MTNPGLTVPTAWGSRQGGSRWTLLEELEVSLATPMMGGGVESAKVDKEYPFRSSEVRGALRRWWRATNVFGSAADLRNREFALWGGLGKPPIESHVRVEVDQPSLRVKPTSLRAYAGNDPELCYLAGIYGGVTKDGIDPELLLPGEGIAFRLRISHRLTDDDPRIDEIRRALVLWLYLGGIGSRTRRGFGTLVCDKTSAMRKQMTGPTPYASRNEFSLEAGFTTLAGGKVFINNPTRPAPDAASAWKQALAEVRSFRAGVAGTGISPWPEADAARRLTDSKRFIGTVTSEAPRAALGMPLKIQSIPKGRQFDTIELAGVGAWDSKGNLIDEGRLASPIIAKAMEISGNWYPAIVILGTGDLDFTDIIVTQGRRKSRAIAKGIASANVSANPGRNRFNAEPDIFTALENQLLANGWSIGTSYP